jgi:hypothetical protein
MPLLGHPPPPKVRSRGRLEPTPPSDFFDLASTKYRFELKKSTATASGTRVNSPAPRLREGW